MKSLPSLSEKEEKILDFTQRFFLLRHRPPTYVEIQKSFGFRSVNSVKQYVDQLIEKGCLLPHSKKNQKPAIRLAHNSRLILQIPVVGTVAAGRPIEAIETREELEVPSHFIKPNAAHFALRVQGDSMEKAHILDKDWVVIRKQATAENGQVVVAKINQEATLKRFYKRKNHIELHPENEKHQVIHVPNFDHFSIEGILVGVIRKTI